MDEPGARQRHQPARHLRVEALAVDGPRDLVRGLRAVRERGAGGAQPRRDQRAVGVDVAWMSVNGRAWPASASRASSRSTTSASPGTRRPGRACSRRRSTARRGRSGGRRRSAARCSGWCRHTCDGAWPGVSITFQVPASVSNVTPGPGRCRRRACPPGRCPSRGAPPPSARSGCSGTPLSSAISIVLSRSVVARAASRSGASRPRSPRARPSAAPGRSGRRGRG